jgi:ribosomal protein L12E/L44/L45/RPP1/RPP2
LVFSCITGVSSTPHVVKQKGRKGKNGERQKKEGQEERKKEEKKDFGIFELR